MVVSLGLEWSHSVCCRDRAVRRDEVRLRWGGVGARTMKEHTRKSICEWKYGSKTRRLSVRSRVINRRSKEAGGVANSLGLCAANVEAEKRPLNDPTPAVSSLGNRAHQIIYCLHFCTIPCFSRCFVKVG